MATLPPLDPASLAGAAAGSLRFGDVHLTEEHLLALLGRGAAAQPPALYVRPDERSLGRKEQDAFRSAVSELVKDGRYATFVRIHADMRHNMHTLASLFPNALAGTFRFLPWHRVFLRRFEEALQSVDPSVVVPYWSWTRRRAIPPWLQDFTPGGVARTPGHPDELPSRLDIWTRLRSEPYALFTLLLEGLTPQVPGMPTSPGARRIAVDSAHSRVHMWVGGDMADLMTSPRDPLFFLHHAEVDRLWHVWQLAHPGDHPTLLGDEATMDPWPETYKDVASIRALGYAYEDETFALDGA